MSPLVDPLREILPLLVASAFVIAFGAVLERQNTPERITPFAMRINVWGIAIASAFALLTIITAILYVAYAPNPTLLGTSFILLVVALWFCSVAFFVPPAINLLPPLWRKTFYLQFEDTQSEDMEAVRRASTEQESGEASAE